MTTLINKLLSIFQLKLISTKPVSLVKESVKFLNTIPKSDLRNDGLLPPYVGDIVYVQEKVEREFPQVSGKTYFRQQVHGEEEKYFDFDGNTYTAEEMREKRTN